MTGRPRKSAALHDHMDRNYTKAELAEMRKAEEDLKGMSEKVSDVPEHLSDLAQDYYKFIVREMEVSGILANLDIPLLTITCETLAMIQMSDEDIKENGLFLYVTDRYGNVSKKTNPAVTVRDKAASQVKGLLTQLGMSPSSRASLAVANIEKSKQEADPLLQILNKAK